jgi:1,4-dihydroxy-2-naphthoyl-CoA hydrolase
MAIWARPFTVEELNREAAATLVAHFGIRFTAIGDDWLEATMPVDPRTQQLMGVLHGGVSVALAETVAVFAANRCLGADRIAVNQSVNANHLRPAAAGEVVATARPIHVGRSSQVWGVDIDDRQGRGVCVARLTLEVRARR